MLLEGSRRPTGGGREGRSPLTFFENRKKYPDFGKMCSAFVHLWVKFSFKMQF